MNDNSLGSKLLNKLYTFYPCKVWQFNAFINTKDDFLGEIWIVHYWMSYEYIPNKTHLLGIFIDYIGK